MELRHENSVMSTYKLYVKLLWVHIKEVDWLYLEKLFFNKHQRWPWLFKCCIWPNCVFASDTRGVQGLEERRKRRRRVQGNHLGGRRSANCPARAGQVLRSRIGGRNRSRRYAAHTWPVITCPAGIESWPAERMPRKYFGPGRWGWGGVGADCVNGKRWGGGRRRRRSSEAAAGDCG